MNTSEPLSTMDNANLQLAIDATKLASQSAYAQLERAQDAYHELVTRLDALNEEKATRELREKGKSSDWAYLLDLQTGQTTTKFTALDKALASLTSSAPGSEPGLRQCGYYPPTMQVALQISLVNGDPQLTQEVERALRETLLEHLKPLTYQGIDECPEPYKRIAVFEASCSSHGSYYLAINELAGQYELYKSLGRLNTRVHSAPSLSALLEYVQEHCYYQTVDSDR